MEHMTIKDILEATGGKLLCGQEHTVIRDFSIDSRQGSYDSIFVPIIGERVDAHKFIRDALKINGATFTAQHSQMDDTKPWIRVDDTLEAMQKVGTFYRNRMNLPVVAVTGSVGKTTTREMIATVLASEKKVFETRGNQNSQVGVPLTLAHLSREDEIAVLEIGMSERGQIEKLTKMIRPNIAVITVIGVSHIAQLKSQENICLEKMDIVKGLSEDGMVFLNGDDPFLAPYKGKLPYKTFFYGLGENCDYRAENIHISRGMTHFTLVYADGTQEVILAAMGEHNVRNALAGLGIAHQMGLDMRIAAASLQHFSGQRQKMYRTSSCFLIDDTYNASPDSMKASAGVLSGMSGIEGRRIAGLADMLELGEDEARYHYETAQAIGKLSIDVAAAYGVLAKELLKGIREENPDIEIHWFETREELKEWLLHNVHEKDALLLKGSNGMGLSTIVEAFLEKDRETGTDE